MLGHPAPIELADVPFHGLAPAPGAKRRPHGYAMNLEQQLRFCRSPDGVQLAYAIAGRGSPLVKAANWLTHLEHDWKTPIWRPFLERLARAHTLIRYDQRGCGLSDWDIQDFSFEACIRDLEAVVETAAPRRFALLGISQGGPLAVAYAVRHPERVSRLILYGAFLRGRLRRDPTPRDVEESRLMTQLIRLGWGRENPAFRQLFSSLFLPGGTPEQFRHFNELQRASVPPENAARIVEHFEDLDVSDLAPRVSVPTLVLHSRGDARIPFAEGRLAAALIPGARFVPLESENHVLLEGEPALEECVEEILSFLADTTAGPAADASFPELTRREHQVLELMARGLDNAAIARQLFLSPKTVRNHVSNIFLKLGAAHRGEAIVRARDAGFGRGVVTGT